MAGKADKSAKAGDNAGAGKPKAKTFSCPNCGASVSIYTPGLSLSAVCDSCRTIIDTTDENYAILDTFYCKTKDRNPRIPLGTKGKLKGKLWQAIGFVVRKDNAYNYEWEEYLLFNPYYGYCWLTENAGHWSLVQTIKEKPSLEFVSNHEFATFDNRDFRLFYKGKASVVYIIGEFYWRLSAGSQVDMADYVSPPYMLSREVEALEVVWSLSEYLQVDEVKNAFKLKKTLRKPKGIAPNQPTPSAVTWRGMSKWWAVFVGLLLLLGLHNQATSMNKICYQAAVPYLPNVSSKDTFTSPVFRLDKGSANVELDFSTDVDNSWLYASGELVNDATNETYPFETTVEYYHGWESGESWSEGSTKNTLTVSSVPAGRYYVNIDTQSGDFRNFADHVLNLTVKRDVPNFLNLFWSLILVSILPAISWYRQRADEVARWSQSDFSPYQSSDD